VRGAALILLGVASCTVQEGDEAQERQAELASIATRCGIDGRALRWTSDGVRFSPPANARYESVDCVLDALAADREKWGVATGRVGSGAIPETGPNDR
jgi:hypothetical protein